MLTGDVWKRRDLYSLLEVDRAADIETLKSAYRLQALAWHPDRFKGAARAAAEERSQAINRAWSVLRDPRRREQYDLTLPEVETDGVHGAWPDPVQNIPSVWKQLAAFLRDEDLGTSFVRQMAYKAGDYLERRRELSPKQRPYAETAWRLGEANGFEPAL